jgi:hypothetical protein
MRKQCTACVHIASGCAKYHKFTEAIISLTNAAMFKYLGVRVIYQISGNEKVNSGTFATIEL